MNHNDHIVIKKGRVVYEENLPGSRYGENRTEY